MDPELPEGEFPDPVPGMISAIDQYGETLALLAGMLGKYDRDLIAAGVDEPQIRLALLVDVQRKITGGK